MKLLFQEIWRKTKINKAIKELPSWQRDKIASCIRHLEMHTKEEYESYKTLIELQKIVNPVINEYINECVSKVYMNFLKLLGLTELTFKEKVDEIGNKTRA